MAFKNQHLSYSRLSRFEQCPLSFKLHYIDKRQAEPGVPLRFGKAVHAVLETLLREHMEQEREGALSEERAVTLWQEAWAAGELRGKGVAVRSGEFLAAGLLGPGLPHPRLAERLGSHVLLMEAGWTIVDHVPGEHEHAMIGVHGGLSADEMRVPLILAQT